MIYCILFSFFLIAILLYFRIADHFNIIDHPNERSSHVTVTIRGAGVIYLLAAVAAVVLHQAYWLPLVGLAFIGGISFLDDWFTLSTRIRLLSHVLAVSILCVGLQLFTVFPWWVYPLLYFFAIGTINAFNFMDGINGITGLYAVVVFLGFQYVNLYQVPFIEPNLIWIPLLASLVFLIFNFRTQAKCFAGDVGSISIAFWIIWLLFSLILKTDNYSYILFLAVYGADSGLTILHRLILKQNIGEAHRLHFYQILANDCGIPHLWVSTLYGVLQLAIIALIVGTSLSGLVLTVTVLLPLIVVYWLVKPRLMKG